MNVWNTSLLKHSAVSIFRGQRRARGNTVSWEEIRKAIPVGLIEVEVEEELQSINKGINVLGTGSVRSLPNLANNNGKQTGPCERRYIIDESEKVKREPPHFIFYTSQLCLLDLRRMFLNFMQELKRLFT